MNLANLLNELRAAIRAIREEGETATSDIATMRAERNRLLSLQGVAFSREEADRVGERIAARQAAAENVIRNAGQQALSAIDDVARARASTVASSATSESVSRRWRDAVQPVLDRGIGLPEVLDLFAADEQALKALEVNLPSYFAAKSGKVNDPATREQTAASLHAVEQRLLQHLSPDDRRFREQAREVEGMAVEYDATFGFALRQANGLARPEDRVALGYSVNDAERIGAGEYVAEHV